jgi:hypothetical protein
VVMRPRKVGVVRHGVLVGVEGAESSLTTIEVAY